MPEHMMRAARFHQYGPPENLVIEEVPRPEPKAGEVLVRVHAAGVHPVDWKIRRGYLKDFMPVPLPFTPGLDLAGTVAAVGSDVTTVQPGQAVFGRGSGAYAEYAIAPANALAPKPSALSFDQAATIPVGASTAWGVGGDFRCGRSPGRATPPRPWCGWRGRPLRGAGRAVDGRRGDRSRLWRTAP